MRATAASVRLLAGLCLDSSLFDECYIRDVYRNGMLSSNNRYHRFSTV